MGWLENIAKDAFDKLADIGRKKATKQLKKVADATERSVKDRAGGLGGPGGGPLDKFILPKFTSDKIQGGIIKGPTGQQIRDALGGKEDFNIGGVDVPWWAPWAALGLLVVTVIGLIFRK